MTKTSTTRDGKKVSIIIATYNEANVIGDMVRDILDKVSDPLEVIIVDDDSKDGTCEEVEAIGDSRIKLIRRLNDRGLASALCRGIIESSGDYIGWLDADAWMMPPKLPDMIEMLSEHDIVLASRYIPGGGDERDEVRVGASHLVNGFARFLLGDEIRDYSSNFAFVRRSVFDTVMPTPMGFGEYFIEFIHLARCRGLSIIEVPYYLEERSEGVSKAFPNWFRFLLLGSQYFFRILFARLRGRGPKRSDERTMMSPWLSKPEKDID